MQVLLSPTNLGAWNARAYCENLLVCFENVLLCVCGICVSSNKNREKEKRKETFEEGYFNRWQSPKGGSKLGSIT